MSENIEELEMEESALSAEELFELHKKEIEDRFEEKGFFRRLKDMFSGLSKPRSSAEFKLARTELQRLMAPLCAVLLPTLGVIILIVVISSPIVKQAFSRMWTKIKARGAAKKEVAAC